MEETAAGQTVGEVDGRKTGECGGKGTGWSESRQEKEEAQWGQQSSRNQQVQPADFGGQPGQGVGVGVSSDNLSE